MTNTSFQKIESDWNEFRRTPFPENGDAFPGANDRDLAEIDTFAAGCISTFIHTSGQLDQQRYDCLKTCLAELDNGIQDIDAGKLKTYVEQLQFISKSVLEFVDLKANK